MKITTVSVQIHEKRNHPHEYGHYDASVTLTADVDDGESYGDVINRLRDVARSHVADECDEWIERIKLQNRVREIASNIRQLRYMRGNVDEPAAAIRVAIHALPPALETEWLENLDAALDELRAEEELAQSEQADCAEFL